MMRSTRLCVFVGLAAIAAALASGCGGGQGTKGPATYKVTGTVTLNGQPVSGASVTFAPSGKGGPAVGKTDASGQYTLRSGAQEGAAAGQYLVGISKYEYADAGKAAGGTGTGSAEMPADYKPDDTGGGGGKNALPAKYESPAGSGLKATVTEEAGKSVIDFKL